jgi:hypothetical protein
VEELDVQQDRNAEQDTNPDTDPYPDPYRQPEPDSYLWRFPTPTAGSSPHRHLEGPLGNGPLTQTRWQAASHSTLTRVAKPSEQPPDYELPA